MALTQRTENLKATGLFKQYVVRLIFRTCVFAWAIYLLICCPEMLDIRAWFGLRGGFNSIDFFFLVILIDILTKFFPDATLSMGSLKQYGRYQVPTSKTFEGGRKGFVAFVRAQIEESRAALTSGGLPAMKDSLTGVLSEARTEAASAISEARSDAARAIDARVHSALTALDETRTGAMDEVNALLHDIDFLRLLPYSKKDLTADDELRWQIRRDRRRQVWPVVIFWIVFNFLIGWALAHYHLLGQPAIIVWTLFFFLFDMICVVLWCPLQLFIMRNRCCTTCQIFNWDGIMTVTPLLCILFKTPFAWILVGMAAIVLIRWELAFVRHPERFDDRSNASLRCTNCTDKLCHVRGKLVIDPADSQTGK